VLSDFSVTNNSGSTINDWSVVLEFDQSVTIMNAWGWGINISGSGSSLSGTNGGYNGSIEPGQSATFAIVGNSDTSIAMPECLAH
jgi:hypothetical protein